MGTAVGMAIPHSWPYIRVGDIVVSRKAKYPYRWVWKVMTILPNQSLVLYRLMSDSTLRILNAQRREEFCVVK